MFSITPYCRSTLWGGSRLLDVFSETQLPNLAEAWLFSLCPEGESLVGEETLSMTLKKAGVDEKTRQNLPLIKLIDTADLLSVQVHPNDEEAKFFEGEGRGKNEMWYILSAAPDAFIYLNLKSTKENFLKALRRGVPTDELEKVPVKAGDILPIPAGMVHALGKGITLLEIQQPSALTYRLWDFMRRDSNGEFRPLHTEKAKAVLRPFQKEDILAFQFVKGDQKSFVFEGENKPDLECIANTPYFRTDILTVTAKKALKIKAKDKPLILICLRGEGKVENTEITREFSFGKTLCLLPGDGVAEIFGNVKVALVSIP